MSFRKRDPLDVYTNEIKAKEKSRGDESEGGNDEESERKSKGNSRRRDVKWKPSENARRRFALERKKF